MHKKVLAVYVFFVTLLFGIGIYFASNAPLILFQLPSANIEEFKSKGYVYVYKVVDGDTIKVFDGHSTNTVRLLGINTPEVKSGVTKEQCYGPEASAYSKSILTHKFVRLETDISQPDRDKYNRLLRYVYLPDGTFINDILVKEGYARVFDKYPASKTPELTISQNLAKVHAAGMWRSCNYK